MSGARFLPANLYAYASSKVRRLAAWLAASASDPEAGLWLVIGFAAAHAVLWTLILINLKAAQDVHMDVAEAYAWGQKFLLGYGKHPPLSAAGMLAVAEQEFLAPGIGFRNVHVDVLRRLEIDQDQGPEHRMRSGKADHQPEAGLRIGGRRGEPCRQPPRPSTTRTRTNLRAETRHLT